MATRPVGSWCGQAWNALPRRLQVRSATAIHAFDRGRTKGSGDRRGFWPLIDRPARHGAAQLCLASDPLMGSAPVTRRGLPLLDLDAALPQERELFVDSVHLSDAGAQRLAEVWAAFLVEEGLFGG